MERFERTYSVKVELEVKIRDTGFIVMGFGPSGTGEFNDGTPFTIDGDPGGNLTLMVKDDGAKGIAYCVSLKQLVAALDQARVQILDEERVREEVQDGSAS